MFRTPTRGSATGRVREARGGICRGMWVCMRRTNTGKHTRSHGRSERRRHLTSASLLLLHPYMANAALPVVRPRQTWHGGRNRQGRRHLCHSCYANESACQLPTGRVLLLFPRVACAQPAASPRMKRPCSRCYETAEDGQSVSRSGALGL